MVGCADAETRSSGIEDLVEVVDVFTAWQGEQREMTRGTGEFDI